MSTLMIQTLLEFWVAVIGFTQTAYIFEEGDGTVEVYAGNDFQLEPSTVCVLATVNNIFFWLWQLFHRP